LAAGVATMVAVRSFDIDVRGLPQEVTPPDSSQDQGACYGIDPEIFFPTTEEEAGLALAHCGVCGVRNMCLAWAIRSGERYRVWGGTSAQHRRPTIRQVA